MKEKVDTGDIILTSYFSVSPYETIETLKLKSMNHLLLIFEEIIHCIYTSETLPKNEETWQRPPYTRKQLDELKIIDPATMSDDEILLRIRATDYCSKYESAYFEIAGKRFNYLSATSEPLV